MTPKAIGRYEVVRTIGRGAMGVVYLARDPTVGREVAIKTLALDARQPASWRTRFLREAEAIGRLNHPGIVTIYRCDVWEGHPYIAMEYLRGVDLEEVVRERPPRPLADRIDLVIQAGEALQHAHERGVVHRDVKPANIRVLDDGRVKLVDFGLARLQASSLTKSGVMMGTIPYMSPEHVSARAVDARSDIFSLGSVAFELLSGRRPFPGEDASVIIHRIGHAPPRSFKVDAPASVGKDLERILLRALEKSPADRYPSAAEMVTALKGIAAPKARAAAGPPPGEPAPPRTGFETVVIRPAPRPEPEEAPREPRDASMAEALRAELHRLPRDAGPVVLVDVLPGLYRAVLARLGLAPRQRTRFFAAASGVVRAALVEAARSRGSRGPIHVSLSSRRAPVEVSALHDALTRMAAACPVEAQIVELRLFGGLSAGDCARHLNMERAVVVRRWDWARALLARQLLPPA